jgi:hypothetical protein
LLGSAKYRAAAFVSPFCKATSQRRITRVSNGFARAVALRGTCAGMPSDALGRDGCVSVRAGVVGCVAALSRFLEPQPASATAAISNARLRHAMRR